MKSVAFGRKSRMALAHRSLGLTGEAGEVASAIKKIIRDHGGKATADDIALVKEKLGDTLYYAAVLAEYFGLKLEDIGQDNLDKSAAFSMARNKI